MTALESDSQLSADSRRARLRRLAALSPAERLERLHALNQQLARLRDDARRSRGSR